jgi:SAM-dependent methyltransferase
MDAALHHQFAEIERDHWWFQARRDIVASVLRRRLGPGAPRRIFDAGCGTGEMLEMLTEFGRVSAVDLSEDAVRSCRGRFGDEVEVGQGGIPADLPGPGQVDMVTAFDVLEHIDDDAGALAAIQAVLPPGGVLALTVPAFAFLWGPHDVLSQHRRRYTRPRLRRLLEDAGFAVDRISYFNTLLFPAVAAVRGFRRLRPGRKEEARSDFTMPPPLVNTVLRRVFAAEAGFLRVASLPVGVSILAVARKPAPLSSSAPGGPPPGAARSPANGAGGRGAPGPAGTDRG